MNIVWFVFKGTVLCYLVANLNKIVSDKTGCGRETRDQCLSEFKAGFGGYYIANALKFKSIYTAEDA